MVGDRLYFYDKTCRHRRFGSSFFTRRSLDHRRQPRLSERLRPPVHGSAAVFLSRHGTLDSLHEHRPSSDSSSPQGLKSWSPGDRARERYIDVAAAIRHAEPRQDAYATYLLRAPRRSAMLRSAPLSCRRGLDHTRRFEDNAAGHRDWSERALRKWPRFRLFPDITSFEAPDGRALHLSMSAMSQHLVPRYFARFSSRCSISAAFADSALDGFTLSAEPAIPVGRAAWPCYFTLPPKPMLYKVDAPIPRSRAPIAGLSRNRDRWRRARPSSRSRSRRPALADHDSVFAFHEPIFPHHGHRRLGLYRRRCYALVVERRPTFSDWSTAHFAAC